LQSEHSPSTEYFISEQSRLAVSLKNGPSSCCELDFGNRSVESGLNLLVVTLGILTGFAAVMALARLMGPDGYVTSPLAVLVGALGFAVVCAAVVSSLNQPGGILGPAVAAAFSRSMDSTAQPVTASIEPSELLRP
jgi:hypothetical protein